MGDLCARWLHLGSGSRGPNGRGESAVEDFGVLGKRGKAKPDEDEDDDEIDDEVVKKMVKF